MEHIDERNSKKRQIIYGKDAQNAAAVEDLEVAFPVSCVVKNAADQVSGENKEGRDRKSCKSAGDQG